MKKLLLLSVSLPSLVIADLASAQQQEDEVEVIEICFAVGDSLEADEGIVTVETDKASMDIPAPFAGKLTSLSVNVGDKIKEGDVITRVNGATVANSSNLKSIIANLRMGSKVEMEFVRDGLTQNSIAEIGKVSDLKYSEIRKASQHRTLPKKKNIETDTNSWDFTGGN